MNLLEVMHELVEEKGLNREVLAQIVQEGILGAYEKKYPDLRLHINLDEKTGELIPFVEKTVSSPVVDLDTQISVQKARSLGVSTTPGTTVLVPFDGKIGRVEIIRARQVIAGKIRQIEAKAVYDEFKDKQGEVVVGVVHKCEKAGVVVKIDDVLGFMPKSLSIPGEKYSPGFSVRALLKEVLLEPRGDNQLILDRISADFLHKLLELEIPEVFEGIVEIKEIVRSPGYRSKVVVSSRDRNIDPVGTCVGVGGSRIKPVLRELGSEKIDIIESGDSLVEYVKNALKPAKISRVLLSADDTNAQVWLDEDQRSLAIGRGGQNIMLASRLTGVQIQLVKTAEDTPFQESSEDIED